MCIRHYAGFARREHLKKTQHNGKKVLFEGTFKRVFTKLACTDSMDHYLYIFQVDLKLGSDGQAVYTANIYDPITMEL